MVIKKKGLPKIAPFLRNLRALCGWSIISIVSSPKKDTWIINSSNLNGYTWEPSDDTRFPCNSSKDTPSNVLLPTLGLFWPMNSTFIVMLLAKYWAIGDRMKDLYMYIFDALFILMQCRNDFFQICSQRTCMPMAWG